MNKKLVAVAIVGLLAAPLAQAQTANVTLYGRLNVNMELVNGQIVTPSVAGFPVTQPASCAGTNAGTVGFCNTTNPNQFRVSSDSSRIGLRGTESLGGGLSAIFQVESTVPVDTGAGAGLGTRDTFVGLQGSWGKFYMGFFHLPYDNIITPVFGSNPTLETGVLGSSAIWAQGFGTKATGCFDCRVGNTVRWDSPVISGFQGMFSYSAGRGDNAAEGLPASNSGISSGGIAYNNGPFMFGAAFQYNTNVRAKGLSDSAYSVAAAYQWDKVRLGAAYERLEYDCSIAVAGNAQVACNQITANTKTQLKHNMYGVDLTINAGPGQIYGLFEYGAKGTGSAPNGARVGGLAEGPSTTSKMYEVSYTYPLSKRTSLYAGYVKINNDTYAQYNFNVNTYNVAIGGKPQGVVAGMWMNF